MSTFVSIGNAHQSFERLLGMVATVAHSLPQPVVVQHGYSNFSCFGCETFAFLEMSEFEKRLVAADLVILQAGGGAVIQALHAGKVPVIVPRRSELGEHVDDHQVRWGKTLAGTGRAVLLQDVNGLLTAAHEAMERQLQQRNRTKVPYVPPLIQMVREVLAACEMRKNGHDI